MNKVIITELLSYDLVNDPAFISARFTGIVETKSESRIRKIKKIFK